MSLPIRVVPWLCLAPFALATVALADSERGSIEIVGHGSASNAPEYATIEVEVTSICYDTARAAKDANASLANELVETLQGFVQNENEKVTATGGPTYLQTEVTTTAAGSTTLCERKWRSTNALKLVLTGDFARLSDIQDAVLAAVDLAYDVDPERHTQTYAEILRPEFHLKRATEGRLQREADIAAYDDARAQFDAFASRCGFQDVHIQTIATPQYNVFSQQQLPQVAGGTGSSGSETPLIPEALRIEATWKFQWTFVAPSTCPR